MAFAIRRRTPLPLKGTNFHPFFTPFFSFAIESYFLLIVNQRQKNLGSRVALLPGKFLRIRKVFARITKKTVKLSQYFQNYPEYSRQGCIFRLKCSHPQVTEDHVLTSAYVKTFRTVRSNAVNKSV